MEIITKKIIILVSNDIATDQRMDRIATALSENGFEVEIVGRFQSISLELQKKKYQQKRMHLLFNKGPFFYLELNFRHLFYLLKAKPTIVYSVDADTALAGVLAKKLIKIKLIFDAHELFSEVPELQGRKLIKKIWQYIEKLIIFKSDIRLTVSQSVANYYSSKYNKPFKVVRNISRAKTKAIPNPSEKYILYQGALNEGRGIEQLIEAGSKLNIKIKIAGAGDITEKLKTMALSNIEFLGPILPNDLEQITANAWLGYNLLDNKSLSYYYSLSNKTFDYIQAGIPQLLPDFPEYQKLNEEWNFGLIVGLSAEEIVNTVHQLLEDETHYNRLKENTIKASKVLTWENEMPKLLSIFKQIK